MPPDDTGPGTHGSKVARVIADHDLEGMAARLERSWTGTGEQRRSLRELADLLNREMLAATMRDAGMQPLSGEVDNLYRLLSDDDVSSGQRAEAEAKLEREGIDLDELRADFVSHQAVHTYLTDYRDVDPPGTDATARPDAAVGTIQRTAGRLESITEGSLERLVDGGDLTLGTFDVVVSTQVYCADCETQYDVTDLIDRGGCDCT